MTPETAFNKLYKGIKKEWKIAFGSTVLIGLLAHGYKFMNNLPNWDSLMDYYYPTHNMIHQGRQFQFLPASFRGFADLPWVIGLLSLLYMGIAAVLLVEILEMHDTLSIIIATGLIAVSPTIISHWGFMFTADCYFFGYLLAVLAVYLTIQKRYGWVVGGICLGVSMGIYQAGLPLAMALILLWMIKEISSSFWKKVGSFFLMGITAAVVYSGTLRVMLGLEQQTLDGHQGMGSLHIPGIREIFHAMMNSYIDTVYYFVGSLSDLSFYGILNMLCMLALVILLVRYARNTGIFHQPGKVLVFLLCLALYPCVSHLFYFVTDDIFYHSLMQFPLVLLYVLLFWLYERDEQKKSWLSWGTVISALFLMGTLIVTANQAYRAETLSYEKTYAMVNRIVDRMEQLPEYEEAKEIAVVGYWEQAGESIYGTSPALAGYTDSFFITHQKHVVAMLNEYFGVELQGVSDEELERISDLPEVQEMPVWPKAESVMQTGDMIILKLGEN